MGAMGGSRLNPIAEAEGFVAVYPETPGGRPWSDGRASKGNYDDVGYILKVVDELVRHNGVDISRVFVGGMSSGGFMTERLVCDAPGIFVAAGIVAAHLTTELSEACSPSLGLPMVYFSGTADQSVPFEGANWVLSQAATRDYWKSYGICTATTGAVAQPDRLDDGTTVSLERIDHCARSGQRLDFYVIEGGGHNWPGAASSRSTEDGLTTQEIKATDTMVAFFLRYGL